MNKNAHLNETLKEKKSVRSVFQYQKDVPKGQPLVVDSGDPRKIEKILKKAIVFIFFIALILFFVLIFNYENKISKYEESISNYEGKIEVAGAIRCTGNKGWFAISDDVHVPINIDRIEVKNGAIVVYYTFTASRIHTFIVTPDETFSKAGFFTGASVGRDRAVINISKVIDGRVVRIDPSEIESKVGNFWIYGLFTE